MKTNEKINSAFFITFSGNCKKALTMYQSCFGGNLYFNTLAKSIPGIKELPIVNGSLVSEKITVYGSDLVHDNGRLVGNFMSIYIQCENHKERLNYLEKLADDNLNDYLSKEYAEQKLIEITDPFDVRWIFGVL